MDNALPEELSQLLNTALGLHKAGKLSQAREIYAQILAQDPMHADALHFSGILAHQAGQPEVAADLIRKAIASKPHVASYHNNLGKVLEDDGDLDAALESYREASRLEPDDADCRFNMGVVLQKLGQLDEAQASYQEALNRRPDDSECHYNLANVLKDQDRLEQAVHAYRESLRLHPNSADAYNNLGNVLHRLSRLDEAVHAHRKAIEYRPDDPKSHVNLGNDLRELGQPEAALRHYQNALRLNPGLAEAHHNLGRVFITLAKMEQAAESFRKALQLKPDYIDARTGLVSVFRVLEPTSYQPNFEKELKECFDSAEVNHEWLARISANQLNYKHRVRERFSPMGHGNRTLIEDIASDELLVALLSKAVNVNRDLELVIREIRHVLFFEYLEPAGIPETRVKLIVALGLQCFNNEYIFTTSADEERAVNRLKIHCEQEESFAPSQELEKNLLLLAMYIPLYMLSRAQALGAIGLSEWSTLLQPLIQRTLKEPLEEKAIEKQVESLGNIEDPTSKAVRAQYEENPYPRWLDLGRYKKFSLQIFLRRCFPHFTPPEFLSGPTRALVAGCGTGQAPILIALTRENTEIVALDLSRRSLAYGIRIARKLGAHNVRFIHGDILHLPHLNQRFHIIECTGVLHHMEDPLQGWRILTGLLVPAGLMKIALYSEMARRTIVAARERIRRRNLMPVSKDIRTFRNGILMGESDAELVELIESEDFYTLSTCRDLLFHAKEHRFTLPRIQRTLGELGLEFIGFDLPTPQMKRRYRELFPEDDRMIDLSAWERFENLHPRAFAGMYVFWCQKPESSSK